MATLGELENIFVETTAEGRHPVLAGDGGNSAKLYVEGTHYIDIEGIRPSCCWRL